MSFVKFWSKAFSTWEIWMQHCQARAHILVEADVWSACCKTVLQGVSWWSASHNNRAFVSFISLIILIIVFLLFIIIVPFFLLLLFIFLIFIIIFTLAIWLFCLLGSRWSTLERKQHFENSGQALKVQGIKTCNIFLLHWAFDIRTRMQHYIKY